MKALSIGRDQACDIVINDSTDVISRRHAILNLSPTGKMTIIDQSRNGTYVNGIRISSNVPVPVSRKDIVSFAHVAKLDWNVVPSTVSPMRYAIMGVVALFAIVCAWFAVSYFTEKDYDNIPEKPRMEVTDSDSVHKQKMEEIKKDSLNEAKIKELKDSLEQVKESKKGENAKKAKEKNADKEKEEKKKSDTPKDSTKNRPIG